MTPVHGALAMSFADLYGGLQEAVANGLVNEQRSDDGLTIYCYSRECVYDRRWALPKND